MNKEYRIKNLAKRSSRFFAGSKVNKPALVIVSVVAARYGLRSFVHSHWQSVCSKQLTQITHLRKRLNKSNVFQWRCIEKQRFAKSGLTQITQIVRLCLLLRNWGLICFVMLFQVCYSENSISVFLS